MGKQKTRMDTKVSGSAQKWPIKGVVIARKCKFCGHHEMGMITETGEYRMLKPGFKIVVVGEQKKGEHPSSKGARGKLRQG